MRHAVGAILAVTVSLCAAAAHAEGDAEKGQVVFHKCAICHSVKAGENKVGPTLFGVVGRHSASVPNFNYSPAMKEANVDWTPETLDHYLADPQKMVPKTRMIFPGLKSEDERQNVIAYLETLK